MSTTLLSGLPAVVLAACALVALAVPLIGWALLARPDAAVLATRENLTRGLPQAGGARRAGRRPGLHHALLRTLTSSGTGARLRRLVAAAGHPPAWPVSRLVVVKLVLPAACGAVGGLYLWAQASALTALVVLGAVVVSHFLPEMLLYSQGQKRQQAISLELADTLDQMTIAVEAGLGFESALARAGQNGKGPLAEELVRTLQDIGVGRPRRDAYLDLAARTGVPDLRRFMTAVVQADQYGVSIADVLRTQAQEMRLKRRQRAEEKAMQIPVKVIFPLILCILPTLFIVLLGPVAIDVWG